MPRIRSNPPPATGRPDVPPSLERLLAQAMAKNPASRPPTAIDLARSLQSIEQEQRYPRTAVVVPDEPGAATAAADVRQPLIRLTSPHTDTAQHTHEH